MVMTCTKCECGGQRLAHFDSFKDSAQIKTE